MQMPKTFAALKTEAENAPSPVELYRIAKASNDKLLRNINKARFLDCMHGRAAEAGHYFENVIPGWSMTNDEIHAIWSKAANGKSAEELVAIIMEAGRTELAA